MAHTREAKLVDRFRPLEAYRDSSLGYRLLPFRFTALDARRYVLTNAGGDFFVLSREELFDLVEGRLSQDSVSYSSLVARQFVAEGATTLPIELLATQLRSRHAALANFTALHIFVVSLRCEHSCPYCQVSRVTSDRTAFDMTRATADRAIGLMFRSPNPLLKVEFQGGESLLNFDLIRYITLQVEKLNELERRSVQFVIATNLAVLDDAVLAFCLAHRIHISTSLDGPAEIHNANRPRPGHDSHARAVNGIRRCQEVLGRESVSALMTTTKRTLESPEAVIDEYVRLGFNTVVLRWLSPFGFATRTADAIGYPVAAWNAFYERALAHMLTLNMNGTFIREGYSSIVLRKMLTSSPCNYVDLQSPAGIGIAGVVYNYDGDVYASDEGRMLAQTGDRTFRLGNVHSDSYEGIFLSDRLATLLDQTMTEATPMCSDCAFEPFCGTDPVFHHATQGDIVGHRPTSAFCARNMFVFRTLFRMIEDDPQARAVLERWIQ